MPLRQREIAVLRLSADLDCGCEWGVHVAAFARQAGLTEAEVDATRSRAAADDALWAAPDAALIAAVDAFTE